MAKMGATYSSRLLRVNPEPFIIKLVASIVAHPKRTAGTAGSVVTPRALKATAVTPPSGPYFVHTNYNRGCFIGSSR